MNDPIRLPAAGSHTLGILACVDTTPAQSQALMRFESSLKEAKRLDEAIQSDLQSRRRAWLATGCAVWLWIFGTFTPWTWPLAALILVWGLTPSYSDTAKKVAELRARTEESVDQFLQLEAPDLDIRN